MAATVALPGPKPIVLELDVTVGDGATLVLEDAPLVVAEGADVLRRTTIRLGVGAVAIVRDLVVLGRAGEGPGRLESVLRAEGPDGVILHDALRIEPDDEDAFVALAPGQRAVGTACALGEPDALATAGFAMPAGAGALHGSGWLQRAAAVSAADVVAQLDRVR